MKHHASAVLVVFTLSVGANAIYVAATRTRIRKPEAACCFLVSPWPGLRNSCDNMCLGILRRLFDRSKASCLGIPSQRRRFALFRHVPAPRSK